MADVTLLSVTLQNNRGDYDTGIRNTGSLTIEGSLFADNYATAPPPNNFCGPVIFNQGALTVNNSAFSNDTSAIANYNNATVYNSTFSGNRGNTHGAVINDGSYGTPSLAIANGRFDANLAGQGAAVANHGGTTTITASAFTNNGASDGGGAVMVWGGTAAINQG